MKKLFRRGLIALLPIGLTAGLFYFVVAFLYDKIGRRIGDLMEGIATRLTGAEHVFGPVGAPVVGFLLGVLLILILGGLFATVLGRQVYRVFEWLLNRLPLVRTIYPYAKQFTEYFVSGDKKLEFKTAVAVPYPSKNIWSIGFMTADGLRHLNEVTNTRMATVFIPTSPTPFTGFVVFLPREDIIPLPISVDEALRIIISCGILMPPGQTAGAAAQVPAGSFPLPPGTSS